MRLVWPPWAIVTGLGWAVGWYVGATVYGEEFGGFVSGGVGGTLGWIGQGALLAIVNRRVGIYWAVTSSALWLAGLGVGVALGMLSGEGLHPTLLAIGLALPVTAIGQWHLLRSRYRRAAWWPISLGLGVVVGGAAVSLARLVTGGAVLGAIGGSILGFGIGLTTGLAMERILSHPEVGPGDAVR